MSASTLTIPHIAAIGRITAEVANWFPDISALRRSEASHLAAVRAHSGPMSDSELRAIIYDSMAAR